MHKVIGKVAYCAALGLCLLSNSHADTRETHTQVKGHNGLCLDLPRSDTTNGNDLIMWPCTGNRNQLWSIKDKRVKTIRHCLDIEGPTKEVGAASQIWDCNNRDNQSFSVTVAGEIKSNYSGQCLDVAASGMQWGTEVILWPCTGNANQRWVFPNAWSETKECGGFYIKSVRWDFSDSKGLVLRVDPTTKGRLLARDNYGGAWDEVAKCKPAAYESWSFASTAVQNLQQQFNCHAFFSVGGLGHYTGGERWDLESYNKLGRGGITKREWIRTECGNK